MSNPIHLTHAGVPVVALAVGCRSRRHYRPPRRPPPVNLGTAAPVRRPRRPGGHQHRPVGAQRRPRGLPRHVARRLRPSRGRQRRHARNDAVAAQAQSDLTTAYNVAAGQPVSAANDLTGTGPRRPDADRRRLPLQLRRPAHGPAHARRPGRSQRAVRLRDRLDADHRVGQLGGAGQRRLTLQRLLAGRQLGHARHHHGLPGQPDGAHEHHPEQRGDGASGRVLARNGAVSLDNNVLSRPDCAASTDARADRWHRRHGRHRRDRQRRQRRWHRQQRRHPGTATGLPTRAQTRVTRNGTATIRRSPRAACTTGFRATVRGRLIKRVVFRLDGKRIASRGSSPFRVTRARRSRRAQGQGARHVQGRHPRQDADAPLPRLCGSAAPAAPGPVVSSPDDSRPATPSRDLPAFAGGSRCSPRPCSRPSAACSSAPLAPPRRGCPPASRSWC